MFELGPLRSILERARASLGRSGAWLVAACGLVGVLAAAGLLWSQHRLTAPADPVGALPRAVRITTTRPPAAPLVVHVAGAVRLPGLVEVPDGARVADVLAAAGGPAEAADLARVNLAEKVLDGARLYIPALGEAVPPAVVPVGPNGSAGSGGGPSPNAPLELNRATADELDELPGVGPATAAAIVAHRDANGPFPSVEALADVRGIGPAKLEALRDLVRV